jgi:hypothetical protein
MGVQQLIWLRTLFLSGFAAPLTGFSALLLRLPVALAGLPDRLILVCIQHY